MPCGLFESRRRQLVRRFCPWLFWPACPSGNYHYVWESKCYCAGDDEPPLRWIAGSWHRGYRALMFAVPPDEEGENDGSE